jgi:hypothetical protein
VNSNAYASHGAGITLMPVPLPRLFSWPAYASTYATALPQTYWDNNGGANYCGRVYESPVASPVDRRVMEHETLFAEPGSSHVISQWEVWETTQALSV